MGLLPPVSLKMMAKRQEEKELEEIGKTLKIKVSDKELKRIKEFLESLAGILVEAYLDGELG